MPSNPPPRLPLASRLFAVGFTLAAVVLLSLVPLASAASSPQAYAARAKCKPTTRAASARTVARHRRIDAGVRARIARFGVAIGAHRRALGGASGSAAQRHRRAIKRYQRRIALLRRKLACQARYFVAVASGAGVPSSRALRVGLNGNSQGYGSGMGGVQDGVRATGAGWTREAFAWDVIEPQSGSWDFSRYDAVLLSAAQRGLMVLPVLMTAPGWAAPAWNAIPSDPTAYGDYVAHVAARYGPGGSFWSAHPDLAAFAPQYFEIWNEPYYVQFSNNDINPGRYARLVKAAGQAGKAANPQAKFLAAAETDVQPTGGSQWVSWTDAMYQAVPDLNNYFDGVAVHPYSGNQAPDAPVNGYVHDKFVRMQTIRDKFVSHGAANKPFWITEIGWSTCTGNNECVSESNQAAYTAKLFDMIKTTYSSYVQGIFLYHYTDFGNGDPNDREQWYGMIHRDGSHKPVYNVLHTAAA